MENAGRRYDWSASFFRHPGLIAGEALVGLLFAFLAYRKIPVFEFQVARNRKSGVIMSCSPVAQTTMDETGSAGPASDWEIALWGRV